MTDRPLPIIVRLAPEIHLKSPGTRRHFTRVLRRNLRAALEGIPHELRAEQGRLLLFTTHPDAACEALARVFGIGTFSPVEAVVEAPDIERLCAVAAERFTETVRGHTYAVRCKRYGPSAISTREVERRVGAVLDGPGRVDLGNPEVTVRIEIHDDVAYLYGRRLRGAGGLPLGIQGRAMVLLSGGFDSAVAAWYLMRRGAAVDFVFCNLGGAVHEHMVLKVAHRLSERWAAGTRPRLHVVDFAEVVEDLRAKLPGAALQVVLKRLMYRAAEPVARRVQAEALVTGEALSQVSSQTLSNLETIDAASDLPVLRPLIGFDKQDIMNRAREIGTFELCENVPEFCAITDQRPMVKSRRGEIAAMETQLDAALLDRAVEQARKLDLLRLDEADLVEPGILVEEIPEGAEIIDCQPASMYADWHLPDAVNRPADELAEGFARLPRDRHYFLYCFRGTQSALLAERMQAAGFEAQAFRGGIARLRRVWEAARTDSARTDGS